MLSFQEFDALVGMNSYVRCQEKKRVDKAIVDYKTALAHIENGGQIGWWVKPGYIVVDIDEGQAEAVQIVKELQLKTLVCKTIKGLHLYFKAEGDFPQRINMVTPFGLKCDYRCANKGYVLLPYGTSGRAFNNKKTIVDMPLEFTPIPSRKDSLFGLKEGEGRNQTMFNHLMAYKNHGADDSQIQIMADLINRVVFGQPMDSDELAQIVVNVGKYQASNLGENPYLLYNAKGQPIKVNERAICDYFVNKGNIFVNGSDCYQYYGGVYQEASSQVRADIKEMIALDCFITQAKIMDVYRLITDDPRLVRSSADINYDKKLVNFKNGVYDIASGELLPHDSKYFQTIQIPHNLKLGGAKPLKETALYSYLKDQCRLSGADIQMLLIYFAYCITLEAQLKTFMVLLGPTNSGKSVLIRFLTNLVGEQNTAALSMHELNMRFYPAQLYGKLLNACADNSSMPLQAIENLKKITGGDQIMHEKKGKEPFFFIPFAKLIFSFNQMPLQLEEKSNAFYGRMRIVGMLTALNLDNAYVANLCSDESVEEILPHLVALLPTQRIPNTKSSSARVESMRQDSDSIHAFINQRCVQGEGHTVGKSSLYDAYVRYCINEGRESHKKHGFLRSLRIIGIEEYRDPNTRLYCFKGIAIKTKKKEV